MVMTRVYEKNSWFCCGVARVTDPAYGRSAPVGSAGVVRAAVGAWSALVERAEGVPVRLCTWAAGPGEPTNTTSWERAPFDAVVESGVCGFFDDAWYPGSTKDTHDRAGLLTEAVKASKATGLGPVLILYSVVGVAAAMQETVYSVFLRRDVGGDVTAIMVATNAPVPAWWVQ